MAANATAIKVVAQLSVSNGNLKEQLPATNLTVSQDTIGRGGYVQKIGIYEEVVSFGDITTNGWCLLQNIDATNYVIWGPESSGAMVSCGKLKPGEVALFRVAPSVVMRAQADTAECLVSVRIYED